MIHIKRNFQIGSVKSSMKTSEVFSLPSIYWVGGRLNRY